MKNKKRIFMKRVISLLLTITMLSGVIGIGNFTINAKNNGKIKDYIIVAKNGKAYNRALKAIDEKSIDKEENLCNNNIIVAKLSEQEAQELNEDSNIIIEENLVLEASIVKPGSKSKKELYKRLKKRTEENKRKKRSRVEFTSNKCRRSR